MDMRIAKRTAMNEKRFLETFCKILTLCCTVLVLMAGAMIHAALCDACDERIVGARYKVSYTHPLLLQRSLTAL
jgi:hypothetical protein